jgi:hypothetical protein
MADDDAYRYVVMPIPPLTEKPDEGLPAGHERLSVRQPPLHAPEIQISLGH